MAAGVLLSLTPPLSPCRCALSKHGHRLLSSLSEAGQITSTHHHLIRRFVASSSKTVALDTLSHLLLSNNLPFALSMYRRISEAPWFKWNPKLGAQMAALLEKHSQFTESEILIAESVQRLGSRDLSLFYSLLIESYSKHGLKQQALDCYTRLGQIPLPSATRRAYESMISGFCMLGLPSEAENMLEEMGTAGFRPSAFEIRLIVQSYGKSGLFEEMRRMVCRMEDWEISLDTVCANVILSCYGEFRKITEMISWIRKMKELDIEFSIRTYNSVLKSCPTMMLLLEVPEVLPLSIEGLFEKLEKEASLHDEVLLVKELVSSAVLGKALDWSSSEVKLDLHGMHTASAYLILLQWLEELRMRFHKETILPSEILVVCGSGKNSSIRGESPVKALVSEMMFRMKSPLKIDRKNVGRFRARGKAVKDWLCR